MINGLVNSIECNVEDDQCADFINGETIDPDEHNHPDGNCYAECISWTILTNKGRCTIEVRNDNNGYYGGSISEIDVDGEDKEHYAHQYFKEVKEDF